MESNKGNNDASYIVEMKCPICKNNFIAAPYHSWLIGGDERRRKKVCSYSCMRKWEREKLSKQHTDAKFYKYKFD